MGFASLPLRTQLAFPRESIHGRSYQLVCGGGGAEGRELALHGGEAVMPRPQTLFGAAGLQPAQEPSPSCMSMSPGWESTVGKGSGNLSQGLRGEKQRVKSRACLGPVLTS